MDRFLIAPFNSGLQSNLKSWMLPEDAFSVLNNAYVWRGRVRKRFGSRFMGNGWTSNQTEQLFSRLRINVGTTNASGNLSVTVPGAIFKQGQQFSVGANIFTVNSAAGGAQPLLTSGFSVGTTDGSGNAAGIGTTGTAVVGQIFTINGTIFTITAPGLNPLAVSGLGVGTGTYNTATSAYTFTGASPNSTILFYPTGTYNISNGALVITGALAAFPVWFYPAEPVMGLTNYGDNGTSINNQPSYAFDTQFAYVFSGGAWSRSGTSLWHGDNLDFFWATNWQGISDNPVVMFVTNFNVTNPNGAVTANDDPIWYFNGTTWTAATGANGFYTGPGGGAPQTGWYVVSAQIIVPFKNRLLLLNTIENQGQSFGTTDGAGDASGFAYGFTIGQVFTIGATTFTVATLGDAANALTVGGAAVGTGTYNSVTGAFTFTAASISTAITANGLNSQFSSRVRYCHYGSPLSSNAWYEANQSDSAGAVGDGGGYNDASTEEQIISAEFIKDRLIVFFERSTWELAYTGNAVQPFQWQKINTELGSESTFSSVPFDTQILTVGNTGVHACTGPNVQRIDVKIPDEVFRITNRSQGVERVHGVRDYFPEMVYWTFPTSNENVRDVYPNRVLVYNYQNGSWSFNNDCFTVFGYFNQQPAMLWNNQTETWEDADFPWNVGSTQAQFRQVIAGNQQGFVVIIDSDESRNERAMQVTDLSYFATNVVQLVIIDHTLDEGDYISLENMGGVTIADASPLYQVIRVVDANNVRIRASGITGVYTGGGNAARISNITIVSKQWNPYVGKDRNVHLQKIDFCVEKTQYGEITVDYAPSSSSISLINDGGVMGTQAMMGTSVLETRPYAYASNNLEQSQENLWHPVYFQTDGTCVQIEMSFSDEQISNFQIAWSPFEMSAVLLYTQPTTARLQ